MSGKRRSRDGSGLRQAVLLLVATLVSGATIGGFSGPATAGESRSWPSTRLDVDCVDYGDYMHWGGSLDDTHPLPGGLAFIGEYLYVAQGGIAVVDISDPMQPVVVGEGGVSYHGLAVSGDHVFGIFWAGGIATALMATDISDPIAPSLVGELYVPLRSHYPAASGDRVYLLEFARMYVVDVSDPTAMIQIATVVLPADGEEVCVVGELAYVALGSLGLGIIDVADPLSPVYYPTIDTPVFALGVTVVGDLAYVADGVGGLQVVDVADPGAAVVIGSVATSVIANRVAVVGDRAYLTDPDAGVQVVDVADPTTPTLVGFLHAPGSDMEVAVDENAVCVQAILPREIDGENYPERGSVQIIDISNPEPVPLVSTIATPGIATAALTAGEVVFVADGSAGVQIVDLSDPTAPQIVSVVATPGIASGLAVRDDHVLVADDFAGLQVVAVVDPFAPAIVGSVDTPGTAHMVIVDGDLAYIADGEAGLQIVDLADPTAPRIVGSANTPGLATGVALVGAHACVADGWIGIQIIDVSAPESPQIVGAWNLPDGTGEALSVATVGNLAYVAAYSSGFHVLDLSVPASPGVIASLPALGLNRSVTVAEEFAYLVTDSPGVFVLDVVDPAAPRLVGTIDAGETGESVAISAEYVFVARGSDGVQVHPRHCDTSVAVFLTSFSVQMEAEDIAIRWSLTTPSDPTSFRLLGRGGGAEWEVPHRQESAGLYLARDEVRQNGGDRVVSYSLYHRTGDETWILLGTEEVEIPAATPGLRLTAVHPNPFNPRTTISFVVDRPQRVEISLFDMAGRMVTRIADRRFEAGPHSVAWQGRDVAGQALPSGTYLLRLRGVEGAVAGKIMLLR